MSEPLLGDVDYNTSHSEDSKVVEEETWNGTFFAGMFASTLQKDSLVSPISTTEDLDTDIQPIRNVIMMISDGMGPASVAFSRVYYQYINGHPFDYAMPLDTIHVGQSRTRSASTLVTDSAAGATAFSCGLKTYNGAVGVDPKRNPCGTVLESAKYHGMKTGLVATSRITHATPASFSAHVPQRDDEDAIAIQQIGDNPLGRVVDLMMGGGYCHFLPKSKGGCRKDHRDLLKEAADRHHWKTIEYNNKTAFDTLPTDPTVLPAMLLFSHGHMDYTIDRNASKEPSLTEMSNKALDLLLKSTASSEKGFFLMIEGSRIDMAAHSNDAATHVHDIMEYQKTVALVKDFVDQHPDTIMISTSDHETGGLSLSRQVSAKYPEYLWYPDVLTKVKQSTIILATRMKHENMFGNRHAIVSQIEKYLAITDVTEEEQHGLEAIVTIASMNIYLASMVSLRAQLGWATLGHSGVDVNLYAYGKGIEPLYGSHENIEIGRFIEKVLHLNLTEITQKLNGNHTFTPYSLMSDEDKLKYTEQLSHYQHKESNLHHMAYGHK
ncbi:alkaline-phosphatase-like protein [Spinellus fusiger]|nr:alkaline-phosphatase-like protein [Spinellus fusiger]